MADFGGQQVSDISPIQEALEYDAMTAMIAKSESSQEGFTSARPHLETYFCTNGNAGSQQDAPCKKISESGKLQDHCTPRR